MSTAKETVRGVIRQFNAAEGSVNTHAYLAANQAQTGEFDFTALSPEYLANNPEVVQGLTRAFIAKHGGDESIIPSHLTEDQVKEAMLWQIERIRQQTLSRIDDSK